MSTPEESQSAIERPRNENGGNAKKTKSEQLSMAPVAPDGGWGWLVVFGSFMIHVIADGLVYSFGLFYVEFLDDFGSSKGETSVVASLMVGISLLAGPLASALVNRFECRITAIVGAFVAASGFVISIWAPNIYFLYFSFGILSGLGFGLLIHPAIVTVGQYFDKRRSLTTGMAVCGSGVGMFMFPPVIQALVEAYAWQGASLVLAGVLLNLCICGALFRPLPRQAVQLPTNRDDDVDTRLLEQDTNISNNAESNMVQNAQSSRHNLRCPTEPAIGGSLPDFYALSHTELRSTKSEKGGFSAFLKELKTELKTTTNFSLLKDIPFLLFAFSGTLTSIGFNAPYIFIPHHAELHGIDESRASFLISIVGITNIFGRVIFGFVGDRMRSKRLYLFCTATVFTGLFTALVPLCDSYVLMATYAALFGFTVGGVVALNWVLLPDLLGVENLASSLGLCMLFDGISTPIGPPLLGWIFDITGTYNASFIIGGVMIVISGLILYPIPCIRSKKCSFVIEPRMEDLRV